jgi:hypothetical protein
MDDKRYTVVAIERMVDGKFEMLVYEINRQDNLYSIAVTLNALSRLPNSLTDWCKRNTNAKVSVLHSRKRFKTDDDKNYIIWMDGKVYVLSQNKDKGLRYITSVDDLQSGKKDARKYYE